MPNEIYTNNRVDTFTLRDVARREAARIHEDLTPGPLKHGVKTSRRFWIVPKGTIPAATDELTPGVGEAYICYLDQAIATPVLKRWGDPTAAVRVFNYNSSTLVEVGTLEPLFRAQEDSFGALEILPMLAGRLRCKLPSVLTTAQATKAACPVETILDGMSHPSTVTLENTLSVKNSPAYIHEGEINSIVLVTYHPATGKYHIDGIECPA